MKIELQFKTLADAEAYLTRQGFRLVPETRDWRNAVGGEAGCYPIEREPYCWPSKNAQIPLCRSDCLPY